MLGALFSQDLALDLGSTATRVSVRGGDTVADMPSVVAVRTRRSGRREVIAVGDEAQAMLGRTPDGIEAVRPVRAGRILVPDVADALVRHLFSSMHGRRSWVRPRVLLSVAPDAAPSDIRAVRDVCENAGARSVHTMEHPLAAARGAGLDLGATAGHMIVDVGGGATRVAVVCLGEVVVSTTLAVAGDVFEGAILRMLEREHALRVGLSTLEHIKRTLGAAVEPIDASERVAGRCLRGGVPRATDVTGEQVHAALVDPVAAIGTGIRRVLEQTPPEIASDVVDHGVILCGGGSQLADLDLALRAQTGLAMLAVETPDLAVLRGLSRALSSEGLARRGQRDRTIQRAVAVSDAS